MPRPTMTINKTCPFCLPSAPEREYAIEVDAEGYGKWISGMFIQDAFPDLSADEREQIKTGIHPACWDRIMAEDDEL